MAYDLLIIVVLSFLTGLAAGYLSGLLGIGAGVVLVPACLYLLNVEFREAKAISLFVIMCVSPLGIYRHKTHGNLHVPSALHLGIPGIAGSLIGVYTATLIETVILKLLFACMLFFTAYRMISGTDAGKTHKDCNSAFDANRKLLPLVGLAGGFLAGLLGVGGGVIMVPAMVYMCYPIHNAIGTSLMVVFMNASTGTASHVFGGALKTEHIIRSAIPITAGALLTIRKGVDTAVKIDRDMMRRIFGYFIIAVGLYMFINYFI